MKQILFNFENDPNSTYQTHCLPLCGLSSLPEWAVCWMHPPGYASSTPGSGRHSEKRDRFFNFCNLVEANWLYSEKYFHVYTHKILFIQYLDVKMESINGKPFSQCRRYQLKTLFTVRYQHWKHCKVFAKNIKKKKYNVDFKGSNVSNDTYSSPERFLLF